MIRLTGASRAFACLALVALVHTDPAWPQTALQRPRVETGDDLMAALDTQAAIAAYREALEAHPDDPEVLWKLARAISNRTAETEGTAGDRALHEEAVALARRAVGAGPAVARTHTTLATALGRYGRMLAHECRVRCAGQVVDMGKEAYRATRRAIELDPYDAAPFVVLGVYHRELATVPLVVRVIARTFLGGYPPVSLEQSAEYLRRAVRLDPDDVTAQLELARTYAAMGRDDDARSAIERARGATVRERLDAVEKQEAEKLLATLD